MSEQEPQSCPAMDTAMGVLAERHRRRVLLSLLESAPPTPPFQPPDVCPPGEEPDAFEVRLCHVDLPKLADEGYIKWDRATNEIARGPQFEDLRPLLRLLVEHDDQLPGDVY